MLAKKSRQTGRQAYRQMGNQRTHQTDLRYKSYKTHRQTRNQRQTDTQANKTN